MKAGPQGRPEMQPQMIDCRGEVTVTKAGPQLGGWMNERMKKEEGKEEGKDGEKTEKAKGCGGRSEEQWTRP